MELSLVKPKVISLGYDDVHNIEKFEISPLEAGQGRGVFGNALRTTLMSNVPGYAITNFKVGSRKSDSDDFVMKTHAFDTISGVTPDIMEVFLRLKECRFRLMGGKEKEVSITKKGPCVVKFGDFQCESVNIVNPEFELFEIIDETEVTFTIRMREGRGYKLEDVFDEEGWISVDAIFSPVSGVNSKVEEMMVNGESGFEKLILEVETTGNVAPKEALDIAIRIIKEGYDVLREGTLNVIENEAIYFDVQEEENKPVVYKSIDELAFSVRAYNGLKSAGINNTGDFDRFTEKEIKNISNVGKNTFNEIMNKLAELNIELKPSK